MVSRGLWLLSLSFSLGSIMRKVEDKFAKDLKILASKPTFDLAEFEAVIDRIRLHVAEVSMLYVAMDEPALQVPLSSSSNCGVWLWRSLIWWTSFKWWRISSSLGVESSFLLSSIRLRTCSRVLQLLPLSMVSTVPIHNTALSFV